MEPVTIRDKRRTWSESVSGSVEHGVQVHGTEMLDSVIYAAVRAADHLVELGIIEEDREKGSDGPS
jgi:hypothetical protein